MKNRSARCAAAEQFAVHLEENDLRGNAGFGGGVLGYCAIRLRTVKTRAERRPA